VSVLGPAPLGFTGAPAFKKFISIFFTILLTGTGIMGFSEGFSDGFSNEFSAGFAAMTTSPPATLLPLPPTSVSTAGVAASVSMAVGLLMSVLT
jgi:hypothetical protein